MSEPIRLITHEAVPKCGSFEVRFSEGRPSRYFYWDDIAGRRDQVDSQMALERAKTLAKAVRDKSPSHRKPRVGEAHELVTDDRASRRF